MLHSKQAFLLRHAPTPSICASNFRAGNLILSILRILGECRIHILSRSANVCEFLSILCFRRYLCSIFSSSGIPESAARERAEDISTRKSRWASHNFRIIHGKCSLGTSNVRSIFFSQTSFERAHTRRGPATDK